jgi:ABC-2 type transport system ATP-binding protein
VVRALDEQRINLDDVVLRRPTLDDVFLALTGHGLDTPNGQDADVAPGEDVQKEAA